MDGDQSQPADEPDQSMTSEGVVPSVPALTDPEPDDVDAFGDLPEPPESGDDAVDQATASLARAMHEPLEVQLAAYELAHRTLQDRLADVEN
jgi:hypothetical protein